MEKYKVRTAALEDLSILLRFEQGIITAERPFDITLKEDPINYYDLRQLILSDESEVVVVEHDSRIIGSGYATIKAARPYLDHKVYAYLGFMYTDAEYRGKGVNRLIVNALKQWSLDRGLNEIRLTVYTDNLAAIRAYEKVGFKQHMIEMRMDRDKLS
ncbi:MAG: GNAT family N-acetyltransferase [Bacteroidota bacterium]